MFNQGLLEGKKRRKTTMDKSGSGIPFSFYELIPGVGLGFGTASSHFAMDDGKIELYQYLGVTAYGIVCVIIYEKLKICLWG